jgi:hypothetical protein
LAITTTIFAIIPSPTLPTPSPLPPAINNMQIYNLINTSKHLNTHRTQITTAQLHNCANIPPYVQICAHFHFHKLVLQARILFTFQPAVLHHP